MKLWAGRFKKESAESLNDFNSSISFDRRLYKEDITGSMAHAAMLGACGVIDPAESEKIIAGLEGILADLESGNLAIDPKAEDIHMFVEAELTARIGDAGKRLHTARSRNDQVALDIRLYAKTVCKQMEEQVKELCTTLCEIAQEHTETVMPGYTHLQRAQPITLAHHLMAYEQMFARDRSRLRDAYARMDELPLGSGALAATTYPIDRRMVMEKLGFANVTANSLDGVADRDFLLELSSAAALIMLHLSRFSEEIILWCSHEFRFAELDDAYATGSSIMPQKKNPDIAELVRGKTGRVYGNLFALLTVMKGLPLAYNKDMQEDKEAFFDTVDTLFQCLPIFTEMLRTTRFLPENMRKAAAGGFINATDCADYLVKKGLPFRDAYKCVGQLVGYCIDTGKTLETLSLEEYREVCEIFAEDVYQAINLETCVGQRNTEGGPSPAAVKAQIARAKAAL
ncbi:MAG: argininosuccinate lyase [Ruminococcaceae bacterium]|nr:argininosuccinate lyase [Oscillospiraceae bacterium]